jgi:hypothetical protein
MLDNKRIPFIAMLGAMALMASAPAFAQGTPAADPAAATAPGAPAAVAPADATAPAAAPAEDKAPPQMENHDGKLNPWTMLLDAKAVVKVVMVGLVLASVFSWTLLITKMLEFGALNRRSNDFVEDFRGAKSIGDMGRIAMSDEFEGNPLADMAGAAAQSWQMRMKREREEELIFRGTQYMSALARWYNKGTDPFQKKPPQLRAATNGKLLKDLTYLLADPTTPETVRYLRKLYKDPITNKDFVPILDANQAIIGVKSTSEAEPLKKGNFPDELQGLNDKKKYSEWELVYRTVPLARATGTGATGLPPVPPVPPVPGG